MKQLFTLLLCIATFNTQAQVQNGGFEDLNFETLPYYWKWISGPFVVVIGDPDSVAYQGGRFTLNSTEVHSGQYAMEIGNGYNYTTSTPYVGTLAASYDTNFFGGFPINQVLLTERPQTVRFFCEYFPEADDSAFVEAHVYDLSYNEIGTGLLTIGGTVGSYSEFVMPITYNSTEPAVAMSLSFHTSTPTGTASLNTRLLVDDVTVESVAQSISDLAFSEAFELYPNPAADRITITGPATVIANSAIVIDALGRTRSLSLDNGRDLDCSALANGVYQLAVGTSAGLLSKSLVIAR
ncbi:MAG: T9SS type A sorting domain-containing protein [Flavobacteriales bacterium]|nr:T9SS type A sorting domain-containing protein [Flavobacteriales bacterium]